MKTFRDTWDDIVNILRNSADLIGVPTANIRKGKIGQFPSSAPFVEVFAQPTNAWHTGERHGTFEMEINIFTGAAFESDPTEAIINALEIAEQCQHAITSRPTTSKYFSSIKYEFDSLYSNYAVATLTVTTYYSITEVNE